MTWFLWQKCSWQAHASMALLVIRLREGAGIPSLEQFSSLPGLGGLPCLTLSKMFWRTLPHQRIPCLLSNLAFIHTYLFKTSSKAEAVSAFCLRRTGMSWEVTVLLHSLHSRHLSESQAAWESHFVFWHSQDPCTQVFWRTQPLNEVSLLALLETRWFSSFNSILLRGSWPVTERG